MPGASPSSCLVGQIPSSKYTCEGKVGLSTVPVRRRAVECTAPTALVQLCCSRGQKRKAFQKPQPDSVRMEEKRVWVPDDKEGWLLGVVKRTEGKLVQVTTSLGGVCAGDY